jgi:hypothetical protein
VQQRRRQTQSTPQALQLGEVGRIGLLVRRCARKPHQARQDRKRVPLLRFMRERERRWPIIHDGKVAVVERRAGRREYAPEGGVCV